MDAVLGIDIAKAKFDVALQGSDGRVRRKSCANTPAGFRELEAWLRCSQAVRATYKTRRARRHDEILKWGHGEPSIPHF